MAIHAKLYAIDANRIYTFCHPAMPLMRVRLANVKNKLLKKKVETQALRLPSVETEQRLVSAYLRKLTSSDGSLYICVMFAKSRPADSHKGA